MRFLIAGAGCLLAAGWLLRPAPPAQVWQLPPGTLEIDEPLEVPAGSEDLEIVGSPEGTTLRASDRFRGEALLICRSARGIRIHDFQVDGNRAALETRAGLPPYDVPFSRFTPNNGILAEGVASLAIARVTFREIAGFAILVNASRDVSITGAAIFDSGSRNPAGRNNTTGGILLEEGTAGFEVSRCDLRGIRGNGIWTHSLYASPRNRDGRIFGNRFQEIGRDAIQVGHGLRVRVEENAGTAVGYPAELVDVENLGTPVGIDSAGDTARCIYAGNRFAEVNGKCIDLDGFHDGEVRGNACVNRGPAERYPFGNFGIAVNNTNPEMRSRNIVIADNLIDGSLFGGIFLIGSGQTVMRNRLLRLNLARCNENLAYNCGFLPGEPDFLRSGIYLARQAERPAPAEGNRILDNVISGYGMDRWCIAAAPAVRLASNEIRGNRCYAAEAQRPAR